jgi:hypothetical protein
MVALPGRAAATEFVANRAARLVELRPRADRPSSVFIGLFDGERGELSHPAERHLVAHLQATTKH